MPPPQTGQEKERVCEKQGSCPSNTKWVGFAWIPWNQVRACYLPRFVWFIRRREGCPGPCAGAVYNLQNIESRVLFTHQRLPMAIQKKNIWPVLDPNNAFCIWLSRNKSIFDNCNLKSCTSEKIQPCHLLDVVSGKLNINQGCTNKSPVCIYLSKTFPRKIWTKILTKYAIWIFKAKVVALQELLFAKFIRTKRPTIFNNVHLSMCLLCILLVLINEF